MGLDIRLPLGALFLITGAMLVVNGLLTRGDAMYAQSGGINLNAVWGAVMAIFGAVMLYASRRARR